MATPAPALVSTFRPERRRKEEKNHRPFLLECLPFRMPLRLHPMEQNLVLWSSAILKETDTGGSSFCYCLFHYGCWKKEGPIWRDSYLCVRFRAEGQKHHLDPEGISKWMSVGNRRHSASMAFPEFQRSGSNSCSSGKGGDVETREEQSRDSGVVMGQAPGSSSRDTQNSIFEGVPVVAQLVKEPTTMLSLWGCRFDPWPRSLG